VTPSPNRRGGHALTFSVLIVAVAAFALLQSFVLPALPLIQAQYSTNQITVTWVMTAYLLSASIATPVVGRLGDALGKQRMMVATLAIVAVGCLGGALAPTIGWLIVARVVQGVGGGVLPLAFAIIHDELPSHRAGSAVSALASLAAIGFGGGIILTGPIVEHLGFDWLFWLPMGATACAAVATVWCVPGSRTRSTGRVSTCSGLLLTGWLATLLLAVSQGNVWGWSSPTVVGLFLTALVLFPGWVWMELHVSVPLIDMALVRERGIWTANLIALLVGMGVFASLAFLPQLMQTPPEAGYGLGASISESGRLLVPFAVFSFVVGLFAARLVRLVGAGPVMCAGSLTSALAFTLIATFHDHAWQLYLWTSLMGIGSGAVFSTLARVVLAAAPIEQSGVASGINANIRTIGGAVGSAVMASLVTARMSGSGHPMEAGYTIGFLVLACALAAAAGVALLLPRLDGP
jgi:MFS family permease